MESELKLLVDLKDVGKIREAPMFSDCKDAALPETLLSSTYYDTPDLAFRQCNASLRVRNHNDKTIQTIKLDGSAEAGLYERDEFEMPVEGDTPDLRLFYDAIPADSGVGKLIRDEHTAAQLEARFVTRIRRTVLPLRLQAGEEIECAIDEGTIDTDTASTSIAAVEMELKQGEPDRLYRIALDLLEAVPLRFDHMSKADRGYEMLLQKHQTPVKARPVTLHKRDSVETAFSKIARNCLEQIHANERGVVSGHDPSSVHQMRVGLRRLRSALDLFDKVIPAYPGLQDELRWIASELGDARDWEVLTRSTVGQALAETDKKEERRAVERACKQIATKKRAHAAAAANSVRYTRLMLQLTHWLNGAGWRDGMAQQACETLQKPAKRLASDILRRRHDKLLKRGRGLAGLDDRRRHRARIAAKKLRYATEFFASLFSKSAVKHYIAALSTLQDDLGWRNDAVVAHRLLNSLPLTHSATASGAAFARGFWAARVAADYVRMKKLWKRFRQLSPPQ
ncbi:inorganic triphosphatase [Burkholderia sp. HI2761]|uniref:CYTH and CHAD domain-containing protein n=1 Tax=unclassified Burkholderia TaxID=2613784 RepID=UPI000B7ABAC1|nr:MULTISPECIES: CYTH and CHAD domain-containing protein [unclassified Burkholderia]MPV55948.1 CHAD domain-containing protein [Burkholderia sp. BE24]OXJ27383.1 inorganic triphosphatase [Burkholderia sp. HI2761]